MTLLTLLIIAIALGTDAFSMAIGIGTSGGVRGRKVLLVAGVVAIFHIFMPLIGLYLGSLLGKAVGDIAAIIGAIVLGLLGIHMIREGLKGNEGELLSNPLVITSGWALIVLAVSVSLDALTVGFGLGILDVNITLTVLTLGLVAGIMTAVGLMFGRRLGEWFGEKAVVLGGVILIGIGIRMAFF